MKRFLLAIAALASITLAYAGNGVWTSSGPYGGDIYDLKINPDNRLMMFVSSRGGWFRTVNGGSSWTPLAIGGRGTSSGDLVFDSDSARIYFYDGVDKVFFSTDSGATFSPTGYVVPTVLKNSTARFTDLPGSSRILLAFSHTTPDSEFRPIINPAVATSLVFESNDLGVTFNDIGTGSGLPTGQPINKVIVADAVGTVLLATTSSFFSFPALPPEIRHIYRSTDGGASWTPSLPSTPLSGTSAPRIGNIFRRASGLVDVFIGPTWYRSVDQGQTWTQSSVSGMPTSFGAGVAVADPTNDNAVFFSGANFQTISPASTLLSPVFGGVVKCTLTAPAPYTCAAITASNTLTPNPTYIANDGTGMVVPIMANVIALDPGFGVDANRALWVGSSGSGIFSIPFNSGSATFGTPVSKNSGLRGVNVRTLKVHGNPADIVSGSHQTIFAGQADSQFESPAGYVTFNGGNGWQVNNFGLKLSWLRHFEIDPTTTGRNLPLSSGVLLSDAVVYAVGKPISNTSVASVAGTFTNGGIFRSADGGNSWDEITTGLPSFTNLTPNYNFTFVSATRWMELDKRSCDVPPPTGPCPAVNRASITAATKLKTGYIASTGVPVAAAATCNISGGTFPCRDNSRGQLMRSNTLNAASPSGVSWFDLATPTNGFPSSYSEFAGFNTSSGNVGITPVPVVIDPNNSNTIYFGTFASATARTPFPVPDPATGIFKSVDGGANWLLANNGIPLRSGRTNHRMDVLAMVHHPRLSGVLWAAVFDAQLEGAGTVVSLYKTTDGGLNWTPSANGIPSGFDIRALIVDESVPDLTGSNSVLYAAGYNRFELTNPGGVFKSIDSGNTWTSISIGLPSSSATALELDPDNPSILHAGTNQGVWSLTQVPDDDNDGIPNSEENAIGDGNGDGFQDSAQGDVGSTGVDFRREPDSPMGVGGSQITVSLVSSVAFSDPKRNCERPRPNARPGHPEDVAAMVDVSKLLAIQKGRDYLPGNLRFYSYPDEIFQFEIVDCASATVDVTFHNENFNEYGWSFRFYGPATPGDEDTVRWYDFSSRATKRSPTTWRLNLNAEEFGSYRDGGNTIKFVGGPACYDDRLLTDGFENTSTAAPVCN